MANDIIVVKAAYDPEAGVWFVESSDLHGINAEAETVEGLVAKLPAIVADLMAEAGDGAPGQREFPIELIAHASTRVRIPTDA